MCGRFALFTPAETIAEVFGVLDPPDLGPRYNVAPTQPIPGVLAEDRQRRMRLFRWGLVPSWTTEIKELPPMINARVETVAKRPSFRTAFRRRRLLVPADGFFEWQAEGKVKNPWFIRAADDRVLAMAGLWERWHDLDGTELLSCTLITAPANKLVAPLHDRMPLMLPESLWERWLDPALTDPDEVTALLQPLPPEALRKHRVDRRVNTVRNDDPACVQAV